jgi:hypothetical protein
MHNAVRLLMGVVSQVTTSLWRRVPPRFGALAAFCSKLRKSMSGTNSRITAIEAVNRRQKFDPLERCHFIGVPARFGMVAWLGGASRERTRPPPKVANRVAIHRVRGLVRVKRYRFDVRRKTPDDRKGPKADRKSGRLLLSRWATFRHAMNNGVGQGNVRAV